MKFTCKVVVITGASSGIGRQASIDFAKHGAQSVVLASRSMQKLSQLAGEIASESNCNTVP
jgi:short-subunit dehydrogenase